MRLLTTLVVLCLVIVTALVLAEEPSDSDPGSPLGD